MPVNLLADKRPLLSPRENEVLDCILSGWLHKETAYELGISAELKESKYQRDVLSETALAYYRQLPKRNLKGQFTER